MSPRAITLAVAIALAATAAFGQSDASGRLPDAVSVIVPVVGTLNGMNDVRWKTDLELRNELAEPLTISISLATMPDVLPVITDVPPRQSVFFPDVVGETFGLDSALSPLIVQTLGRRSVTVRAAVYGVHGDEVTPPQWIPITYGASYFPQRTLHGLSFSDRHRTNIGLVNLSSQPAEFTLAVQRLAGRNLAVTRIVVPPETLWHLPVQALFPLISRGGDFSVLVETGTTNTFVYASVIENATSVARFVQPAIGGSVVQQIAGPRQ